MAHEPVETIVDMPNWTIGSMLEKMRRDANLNQQELADRAEISIGTLGKILREETKEPERPTLEKIANAFGMTELDLQLQLKTWNAAADAGSKVLPMPPVAPAFYGVDRRRPESTTVVSERAKELARSYDQLTRAQRLAVDAIISAFEEANDPKNR